jgi:WD40-like Beta Propeller Repeat
MRLCALCAACVFAALALAAGCAPAGADVFGPISLVSSSPLQQADYAHDAAISGDGRYVVFDGSIGGVTGVWRRELRYENGAIAKEGNVEEVAGGDAILPSISENGQYVSFTTNEGESLPEITDGLPVPEEPTREAPNVYVRNMALPASDAAAFELASAVNGSMSALEYEYASGPGVSPRERELHQLEVEKFGSMAAGRSALSANGRKVAFVTTAPSDLDGPKTPAMEVAVRDLETDTTEIVSVEYDPATGRPAIDEETGLPKAVPPVSIGGGTYGAVYAHDGRPPRFEAPVPYSIAPSIGASISADGSTVAWMGENVGAQAPTLPDESLQATYAEPLWRRIEPEGPTRRVTGGSDPTNPACVASGQLVLPSTPSLSDPCQGPFVTERTNGPWRTEVEGEGDVVPRLSKNGEMVAFIANAPLVSSGSNFGKGTDTTNGDAYVADMEEGLSRQQALRPLTELASGEEAVVATNAPVVDLDISPEGNQVAFSTRRTVFPLSSLAYVSAPLSVPGMLELYDVDLENETLTRVTHGYEGGPSEHPLKAGGLAGIEDRYGASDGAQSPSFSDDGDLLAFSSTASNLVYGDGNTPPPEDIEEDGSDAFVLPRIVFGATPAPQLISSAPPNPSPSPAWSLGVTASSSANGSVRLYVDVPGSGTLSAKASATVIIVSARASRSTRRASAKGRRAAVGATLLMRTVATARQLENASGGGLMTLLLTPASSYAALAARQGGLAATVEVSFSAPGEPVLRKSIEVTFVSRVPKRASRRAGTAVKDHARERGGKRR